MISVLQLLDEIPAGAEVDPRAAWFSGIEHSLSRNPQEWTSAISRIGQLSDEHAWSLLSWVEVAATQVVRTRSQDEIATAVFAVALAMQSGLDRRDCAIVASLLRRASELADLDFATGAAAGCYRAGPIGHQALDVVLHAAAGTPATHRESGAGDTFAFTRTEPGFDVDDLERWLEDRKS